MSNKRRKDLDDLLQDPELNLEIRLKDDNTDFINGLADFPGVESAVLVSYNGDYMG